MEYICISDICEIEKGERILHKDGVYPVYSHGQRISTSEFYNRDGFTICIDSVGMTKECVFFVNGPFLLHDTCISIRSKNTDKLNDQYLGCVLMNMQENIYDCSKGNTIRRLHLKKFKDMIIPVPSLEIQKQMIEYCIQNDNHIHELEKKIQKMKELEKHLILGIPL